MARPAVGLVAFPQTLSRAHFLAFPLALPSGSLTLKVSLVQPDVERDADFQVSRAVSPIDQPRAFLCLKNRKLNPIGTDTAFIP